MSKWTKRVLSVMLAYITASNASANPTTYVGGICGSGNPSYCYNIGSVYVSGAPGTSKGGISGRTVGSNGSSNYALDLYPGPQTSPGSHRSKHTYYLQ